jgi:hypothetical protein
MKRGLAACLSLLFALLSCQPLTFPEGPEEKIDALALWLDFKDRPAEAEALYKGKVLEVSGWARFTPAGAGSKNLVRFEWRDEEIALVEVGSNQTALFAPQSKDKFSRKITLKATCQGADAQGKVHFAHPFAVDLGN